MSPSKATSIRFEHDRTILATDTTPEVVLPVGADTIAKQLFRHDPPTPGEIEQAIDWVEDGLASTGLKQANRGALQTQELRLLALLDLDAGRPKIAREEVESRFQRLASISLGHPHSQHGQSPDSVTAAMLLILRECMHHLGYDSLKAG